MKSSRIIAIAIPIIILLIVGGLKVWFSNTPLHLNFDNPNDPVVKVYNSVTECGLAQKQVYLVFEEYQQTFDEPPSDIWDLVNKINHTNRIYVCPAADEHEAGQYTYKLYPENYGNANAVFIEESRNAHANCFTLWLRGIKPCVKTMGDGTIQQFKNGQVATMQVHDNK
jgi:hypothetical protein